MIITLVGIILAGILPVYINVISTNKSSDYYGRAYKDLDAKIDEIRATSFDNISLGNSNFNVPNFPGSNQGQVAVTNVVDGTAQANIKKVTVTISWNFRGTKKATLVTYVARGGVR